MSEKSLLAARAWLASCAWLVASCATVASPPAPERHHVSEAPVETLEAPGDPHACELFSPDGAQVPVYFEVEGARLPSGTAVRCERARYASAPASVRALAEADPPSLGFVDELSEIEVQGRVAWVGSDHVARGALGSRGGRWLVHLAEVGHGDCRHCRAWILSPSRRAIELGPVSCESTWTFSPGGRTLAFGSWEMKVFALEGDEAVLAAEHPSITSPAYAPDGRLFARRNVGVDDPGPGRYGEHWQCVERVEGEWRVAHPGAPQLFEECEECSCGPDELPPAPVVDASGLLECPLPPSEQHPVSF